MRTLWFEVDSLFFQILSIPELDVVIEFQNLRARNEHPTDDDPIL